MITTIRLHDDTKQKLDLFRAYRNESYDEIIQKLMYIVNEGEVRKEVLKEIETARKRVKTGEHVTYEELKKQIPSA
jgi:predicted transcriptional regulator